MLLLLFYYKDMHNSSKSLSQLYSWLFFMNLIFIKDHKNINLLFKLVIWKTLIAKKSKPFTIISLLKEVKIVLIKQIIDNTWDNLTTNGLITYKVE